MATLIAFTGVLLMFSSVVGVVLLLVRVILNRRKDSTKKNISKPLLYIPISFVIGITLMISGILKNNNEVQKAEEEYTIDNSYSVSGDDTGDPGYDDEDDSEEYDTGDLDDYEVKDTINTFIDDNFSFDVTMDNFELNEHMGTNDEDDYIALVYLDMPTAISVKKGYDWIDKYTNYLAAELAGEYEDIHELVIFWKLAGSENNVAKYVLKREGKNFVFESKWQDPNVTD